MVSKRILMSGAGACLAVGAIVGPAHAQFAYDRDHNVSVQERAYEEHAPLGIGLGGFLLYPEVTLGAQYNDNIYASPTAETEDWLLLADTSARVASQWSRHALNFFGGVTTRTYTDNGDDNAYDWRLGADGRFDIVRDMYVEGGAAFGQATESRFSGNGPAALTGPIEFDFTEANARLVRDVNRIRASIGFDYGKFDFQDGQLNPTIIVPNRRFDQDDRDNEFLDITARGDFALSPDTAIFGSVTHHTRDFDKDGGFTNDDPVNGFPILDRDAKGWRYLVGANFDLTSVVRGEVAVGYDTTEYDSPLVADVDGLAAYGQIEWFVTQITTLTFNAARETDEAGITGAAGIERTSFGARVDHELRRDIILTGGYAYNQDDYVSYDREDDRAVFDAGVDWYTNRFLKLGASYERYDQDSAGVQRDRDFTANVFTLKATVRR
jgi:hypothetical protein